MSTALFTLNILKILLEYMIAEKKIIKNYSLHNFTIQTPKSSPFLLLDKNSLCIYNQLYTIILSNICYCQMGYISLLSFYKLRKMCLEVKL